MSHVFRFRLAAAAIAVLAVAACGKSTPRDSSQVVAKVNDAEISVHQVNQVLQRQSGLQPEQVEAASKEALERLIDQEIAVQKALKLKVEQDPAVMQALAAARRDVLARAYAAKVADSAPKPEPADIRAYYEARPGLFAQRRVFLLQELAVQANEQQTAELKDKVKAAKNMQEVLDHLKAKALPVRSNQSTQPIEALPPALGERVASLKDGQALMMPAPGGARIVFVAGSRVAPLSLEQATPAITQMLMADRRRQAVENDMRTLRTEGQVKYVGKFASATPRAASAPALTPLPSTSPASGADSGSVDDATMRKGLSGLN